MNDCASDMRQFLLRESEAKKINLPEYLKKFINLKKIFPSLKTKKIKDMDSMLSALDMEFIGIKKVSPL